MFYMFITTHIYTMILITIIHFGNIKCHDILEHSIESQAVNFGPSDNSVHDSRLRPDDALQNDTRNRHMDARYLPTTTSNIPQSVFIFAPHYFNDSTHNKDTIIPASSSASPITNHTSKSLCQRCACTEGDKEIYCEHNHISNVLPCYLNISADIIPKNATFIRFKDYDGLHIEPGTFRDMELKLKYLEIINIPDIKLEENALSFHSKTEKESIVTKIQFENCSFTDITSGAINQIGITNTRESNEIKLNNVRMLTLNFK
ncbi:unnamed protein product, partial [Meganyctiphanes norvegica]